METNSRQADIHGVLERHDVRYEVRPYYVVLERRPIGAPPLDRRIQAGFDVDLYGNVDKMQLPLFHGQEGCEIVDYFKGAAQQIQSKAARYNTKIEVMPYADSLILDTQHHLQPEAMLRIRISHTRGLDQPVGPSEEQALEAIREMLHELGLRPA